MSERIARVSPAQSVTLRDSVCGLENLYPGLDVWFARRIEPGLRDGSRIGLTAFRRGLLAGSAVVRPRRAREALALPRGARVPLHWSSGAHDAARDR